MMVKRKVLDDLQGYDESLAYEDFDFWIRSGKITKYCYTDKALVKKRVLKNSLSSGQYKWNSVMLASTYRVCLKAEKLNESEAETRALCQIRNLKPGLPRSIYKMMNSVLKLWV